MTLLIQGQPVERIVVHGSEQTVWECSAGCGNGGDGGAMLKIASLLEELGITEKVDFVFDTIYTIEPYGSKAEFTDAVNFIFDQIHTIEPYGSKAGIADTVRIFINDEERV